MDIWNAIFRAGRHTDSAGVTRDFSTADLDAMVAGYDPAKHEAPLVIGHPKTDGPAYGWVAALKRDGDRLLAKFKEVPSEVKQAVAAGRFKKVSVALYPTKTLRHVGLLGAAPPAIKGLGSVSFAAGEDEWQSYEFSDSNPEETNVDIEKLKEKLAASEARADAADARADASEKATGQAFAETAEAKANAKTAEDAKAKSDAEFAEKQAAQAAKDREVRFNELTEKSLAVPGEKETVIALAEALGGADALEFSEDGKTTSQAAEETLWKFLENRPTHKLLGEYAEDPGKGDGGGQVAGGSFAANF